MFVRIILDDYVKRDSVVADVISMSLDKQLNNKLIKGITTATEYNKQYNIIDSFYVSEDDKYFYYIVGNNDVAYVVRQDNVVVVEDPQDVLERNGFSKLIRSNKTTILIDEFNNKEITTLDNSDKDDPEKAVMILLLKHCGFNIDDIYAITELIKN